MSLISNYAKGDFDSRYGIVHMSNPGPKNDPPYGNVKTYNQPVTGNTIVLQAPALRAFKDAEQAQTPRWLRRKGKIRPIRITGHGYRSYGLQSILYEREPGRFANPDGSNHVEALAVDLDTGARTFSKAKRALQDHGFRFTVEGEVWHGSFRMSG